VALVREAQCAEAVNLLEAAFAKTPANRHDELWRDLLRAYELAVGVGTFESPDPKRFFVPPLIDGWMLPDDVAEYRPETGWRARLQFRLLKDVELSNLLTARAGLKQTPGLLKKRLRQEIKRLDASAVAAKMWLVLGPLDRLTPKGLSRTFPAEAINRGQSFTGVDGPVRWTFKLVEPETYAVPLPHPRSEKDALYNALTFVYLDGDEPHEAKLQVTGSAASESYAPVVWVNREFVPSGRITLKPGTNEIVLRIDTWKRGKPITFGVTLTEPDGKRSTAFTYVDLIKHLGVRTTPPPAGQ
jgi:DNA segregation ATPase FtsK/SpoIIIE-like protein